MKNIVCSTLIVLIVSAWSMLPAEESSLWMTDFAAAQKKAAAEGKDLLIDFTGSDWCHWCIKLHEEVLGKEAFTASVTENFILVELDFPQNKEQSAELVKQNQALQERYGIQGFPTVLLTDSSGAVYARTGYQAGGEAAYLEHLSSLRAANTQRAADLQAAQALEGEAKILKLNEILQSLVAAQVEAGQEEIIAQITMLDPQDTHGFVEGYTIPKKMSAILGNLRTPDDLDKAIVDLNLLAASTQSVVFRQNILSTIANIYSRGKQDDVQARAYIEKAIAVDPQSEASVQLKEVLKTMTETAAE